MTIDKDQLGARMRRAAAVAEEDGCGVYIDPRDLTALLDALAAAEDERDAQAEGVRIMTAHRDTALRGHREAEARLQAVRGVLQFAHEDGRGNAVVHVLDIRRALDGDSA